MQLMQMLMQQQQQQQQLIIINNNINISHIYSLITFDVLYNTINMHTH
eukprot:UN09246